MARIIPSGLRELRATGSAERELETLALLADALPDSCTVYHGVHWTQIERGLSAFGEIDFIIVAASGRSGSWTRRALLPAIIESLLRPAEAEFPEAEHIHRFLGERRCWSKWLLELGWRGDSQRETSTCHCPAIRVSEEIPRRSARCGLAESTT